MTVSLSDRVGLVGQTAFQNRCLMASILIAGEVMTEPATTDDHAARVALATAIINDPMSRGLILAAAVVSNDTIAAAGVGNAGANITDTQIMTQLRAVWNLIAGVAA